MAAIAGAIWDLTWTWAESHLRLSWLNSLAPGRFEWNFRHIIFKLMLVIDGWGISCEIALIWMSLDFTDDQSTLGQVMAWCCQATSHYLSQCWPRSLSPYGVTRPQWVKSYLQRQITETQLSSDLIHDLSLISCCCLVCATFFHPESMATIVISQRIHGSHVAVDGCWGYDLQWWQQEWHPVFTAQ